MPEFVELFIAEANRRLAPEELVGKSHFDSVAQLGELSPAAVGDMLALGPFGRENPMVRLVIESAEVASDAKLIGSQANHTKVRLRDATLPGGMDFLCWQSPDLAPVLRRGVRVDALVVPKKRVATKPSRAAKARRLDAKRERSEVKRGRSQKNQWE